MTKKPNLSEQCRFDSLTMWVVASFCNIIWQIKYENNLSSVCTSGLDIGFAFLSYVQVAILGVVQGITELLPISSTAHMRVVPALLGWRDPGSAFSAAIQLAALAAVINYFWRDVRSVTLGSTNAMIRFEK